eukprot:CAMPEP_0115262446 /NCGR_PEP_ID=MMETSP0270-20121206/49387_1 /TAXON_ID=71861 /ORGANISM="Scrippsiella trochoidea, Strain CCMP3099" /LENGTH=145 /DNA_ID=CAMNT_0002678373 /DNA_START=26 /DNA_END=463 /DNA_ORIENTATION=-
MPSPSLSTLRKNSSKASWPDLVGATPHVIDLAPSNHCAKSTLPLPSSSKYSNENAHSSKSIVPSPFRSNLWNKGSGKLRLRQAFADMPPSLKASSHSFLSTLPLPPLSTLPKNSFKASSSALVKAFAPDDAAIAIHSAKSTDPPP